jgi:hypothetical protein
VVVGVFSAPARPKDDVKRSRRFLVKFLTCFAAVWLAVPLPAAAAMFGQRVTVQTEEKSEENRSEEQRTVENTPVPFGSGDRSRRGRSHLVLAPPTTAASAFAYSQRTLVSPRTESGHTVRNGLGTFYRC